jgi:hypothetical protein
MRPWARVIVRQYWRTCKGSVSRISSWEAEARSRWVLSSMRMTVPYSGYSAILAGEIVLRGLCDVSENLLARSFGSVVMG